MIDGTIFLTNAQFALERQYQLARGDSTNSKEIARLEQLLTAVQILLEARTCELTFH